MIPLYMKKPVQNSLFKSYQTLEFSKRPWLRQTTNREGRRSVCACLVVLFQVQLSTMWIPKNSDKTESSFLWTLGFMWSGYSLKEFLEDPGSLMAPLPWAFSILPPSRLESPVPSEAHCQANQCEHDGTWRTFPDEPKIKDGSVLKETPLFFDGISWGISGANWYSFRECRCNPRKVKSFLQEN